MVGSHFIIENVRGSASDGQITRHQVKNFRKREDDGSPHKIAAGLTLL